MSDDNHTMKALVLENYGEALQVQEVPRPLAGKGEVLVRIHASGINPLDIKIKAGHAGHAKTRLPAILGIDLAGVVEAVGEGVTRFKEGDEVYGMTGGVGGIQGTLAEYAAADADLLAIKPSNFSMRQAAAMPLVFITAWEGLVDRARVQAGQQVLIHGGAGGIGHMAVQLARSYGADVYATVSSGNKKALIQGYGATPIDYVANTVEEYLDEYTNNEGFDIVFDTIGGATLDASFTAVKKYTGHVVSALGWGSHSLAPLSFRGATYSGIFTLLPLLSGKGRKHHGAIMEQAAFLAEAGKLLPLLDKRRFTMEAANEAYSIMETQTATGKLVIEMIK